MTPKSLAENAVIDSVPAKTRGFDPRGQWSQIYRIWGSHGFRDAGNYNSGVLRIKKDDVNDKTFKFIVQQKLANAEGLVNIINVEMMCCAEKLSYPEKWKYKSYFLNPEGKEKPEFSIKAQGSISGNILRIKRNGHLSEKTLNNHTTCNWCVYESLQRMESDQTEAIKFDLLEDMDTYKPNQKLYYRDKSCFEVGGEKHNIHRYTHIGSGNLPIDYWLDDSKRLLVSIVCNKAYILDEKAEEKYSSMLNREKDIYQNILNKPKAGVV